MSGLNAFLFLKTPKDVTWIEAGYLKSFLIKSAQEMSEDVRGAITVIERLSPKSLIR